MSRRCNLCGQVFRSQDGGAIRLGSVLCPRCADTAFAGFASMVSSLLWHRGQQERCDEDIRELWAQDTNVVQAADILDAR